LPAIYKVPFGDGNNNVWLMAKYQCDRVKGYMIMAVILLFLFKFYAEQMSQSRLRKMKRVKARMVLVRKK
jgi:hypothetical protein